MTTNRVAREREYWQHEARREDVDRAVCDPGLVPDCLDEIEPYLRGEKVLEIGVGVGRLLIPLALKHPEIQFVGVDISEEMARIAAARAQHVPNVRIIAASGRYLPYNADTFYSVAVFQHVDDEGMLEYLQQVGRRLRPDGVFRFQFIEGEVEGEFSQHRSMDRVCLWLSSAGLEVAEVQRGRVLPIWTWVTARRRSTSRMAYVPSL